MEESYQKINESTYFSKMAFIPKTPTHMYSYLTFHAGAIFFEAELREVCKRIDISPLQFDALFFFSRICGIFPDNFKNKITNTLSSCTINFVNAPPAFIYFISQQNFIEHLAENISDQIFYEGKPLDQIEDYILRDFATTYSRYLEPFKEAESNIKYRNQILNFLTENLILVKKFFKDVSDILMPTITAFCKDNHEILDLCKKSTTNEEEAALRQFIALNQIFVPDFNTDKMLLAYYEFLKDTADEMEIGDLFWDIQTNTQNKLFVQTWEQTTWYDRFNNMGHLTPTTDIIKKKLEAIGMTIDTSNQISFFHSVVQCFVEHKFFSNEKEAAELLYNIMLTERNTVGYSNKYDTMNLYDHIVLIIIANDLDTTYDKLMEQLLITGKIPFNFPVEIILRIFSRIFNITIILHLQNFVTTEIDNTISQSNIKLIQIYQYSNDYYYNIFPLGETFVPANATIVPQPNLHMNNTEAIVEV